MKHLWLYIAILLFFLWPLSEFIWQNKEVYLKKYNDKEYAYLYQHSQFAENHDNRKFIMEDWDVYTYAGWHYVKGENPAEIDFPVPPLGKIFIGLSIKLFGNQNIGQLFWGIGVLFIIYLLSQEILKNRLCSLVAAGLVSIEPLFREQLTHSMLDIIQLFGILGVLFLAVKPAKSFWRILGIGLFIGLVVSVKVWFTSALLLIVFSFYELKQKKDIKAIVLIGLFGFIVYLISYWKYFFNGRHLFDFAKLQFEILKWYRDYHPNYPKFEIWRLIFTGSWRTWWGSEPFIKVSQWWQGWPIAVSGTILSTIIWLKKKKKNKGLKLLILWTVLYLAFNSTHIIFPRYLLLVLPTMWIITLYGIKEAINHVNRH